MLVVCKNFWDHRRLSRENTGSVQVGWVGLGWVDVHFVV